MNKVFIFIIPSLITTGFLAPLMGYIFITWTIPESGHHNLGSGLAAIFILASVCFIFGFTGGLTTYLSSLAIKIHPETTLFLWCKNIGIFMLVTSLIPALLLLALYFGFF